MGQHGADRSLTGLEAATSASVTIAYNDGLPDLRGLESLTDLLNL